MTSPAPEQTPVSNHAQNEPRFLVRPSQLIAILALYFGLHILLRNLFSSSVDLDESEAVVLSQVWSWGYGPAPPLYTWLQMAIFSVLGQSILAISLLKNALLFGTYALTFVTSRLILRNTAAAIAATLSLLFLPQIAWESQRDLTHSVLSATLSIATLYCLLRLQESRLTKWYLAFGLCAGLGLLSKYNYALWLCGLVLAAFTLPPFRAALWDARALLSLALALACFLPNGLWMMEHRDLALLTSSKFQFKQSLPWSAAIIAGMKDLLLSILAFSGGLLAIYTLIFFKAPPCGTGLKPVTPDNSTTARHVGRVLNPSHYPNLILRAWGLIGLILVCVIVFTKATGFRERWFQPILIALPIVAMSLVENRLSVQRLEAVTVVAFVIMGAVLLILPGRLFIAERLQREEPLTRPYNRLAAELRSVIPPGSRLVCDSKILAGNLRLGLGEVRVFTPPLSPLLNANTPHAFLAWDARKSDAPPQQLLAWAATNGFQSPSLFQEQPRFFKERYRYHQTKEYRIGLLQIH